MNKDVIYIDVDDDVTAIIGKIKSAKEKIVALVPPKRAGALQSAVNLRLLDRMARNDNKKLVLITNNHALVGLAAAAKIPVAKNLQSKPEVAEVPALIVDDGDDIIDGSELPVGEHASMIKVKDGTRPAGPRGLRSEAVEETDLEIDGAELAEARSGVGAGAIRAAAKPASKKGKKVPNFDSFRKKIFLGIGGGIALAALLVWMFVFAPAATVVITARTTPQAVSSVVRLGGAAATNFEEGIISSVVQQEKRDETIEFDATGRKDVGEKATGTLRISKLSQQAYGVPAGTRFTASGGAVFVTQTAATIPEYSVCFPTLCAGSTTVKVVALNAGTEYNGISGGAQGPDGVSGTFQGATSGGTTKMARVVSADDVERAKGEIIGRSTDSIKKALAEKFKNGELVIESSFTIERGDVVSSPAVDTEAESGKATLTMSVTYSIHAVSKTELDKYLKASLDSSIDKDIQKIYSTGIDDATLSNFRKEGDTLLATLNANGRVGPTINEDEIKEQVKGKRYGEVQQSLEEIEGIKEADTRFSYFWVRTVPNNTDKISIEFKVEDE